MPIQPGMGRVTKAHRKHFGCLNEMLACVWLLDNGYEVFRNVSAHGNVDVVAIDSEGRVRLIDIKSASSYTTRRKTDSAVEYLFVETDTGNVFFDTRPAR
jgi:hypothetical protein